jgi:hypothetical protein
LDWQCMMPSWFLPAETYQGWMETIAPKPSNGSWSAPLSLLVRKEPITSPCLGNWPSTFFFLLWCQVEVHCGIYKNSYNISYLNPFPPPFSFMPFSPHYWNSLSRYHFSIYILVYTVFAKYSLSTPFLHLSCPNWYHPPQSGPFLASCYQIL